MISKKNWEGWDFFSLSDTFTGIPWLLSSFVPLSLTHHCLFCPYFLVVLFLSVALYCWVCWCSGWQHLFLAGFPDARSAFSFHSLSWCFLSAAPVFQPFSVSVFWEKYIHTWGNGLRLPLLWISYLLVMWNVHSCVLSLGELKSTYSIDYSHGRQVWEKLTTNFIRQP